MTDCPWIGGSVEYPDVPEWMRVSEHYGRGYREIEKAESEAQAHCDNEAYVVANPDEYSNRWTEAEGKYVADNYGLLPTGVMMDYLNRSARAIRSKALRCGVPCRKIWTPEETDYVLKHYAELTSFDIAKALSGRSPRSIRQKACRMGLRGVA